MTRLSKFVLVTAIIAAAAIAGAAISYFTTGIIRGGSGRQNIIPMDEEQSFTARDLGAIRIATGSTDIRIVTTAGTAVIARLHGSVGSASRRTLPRLIAGQKDGVLEIRTERPERIGLSITDLIGHLTLELSIPADYRQELTVKTGSGDITVSSLRCSFLDISTGSGDMTLRDITAATLHTNSGSGDLTARELSGDTSLLVSASGDIRIEAYRGGADVRTSSGDVRLQFGELTGNIAISTASSDVFLTVPGTSEFRLQARSSSGKITSRFPLQPSGLAQESGRRFLAGTLGRGRYQIDLSTSSGDIILSP